MGVSSVRRPGSGRLRVVLARQWFLNGLLLLRYHIILPNISLSSYYGGLHTGALRVRVAFGRVFPDWPRRLAMDLSESPSAAKHGTALLGTNDGIMHGIMTLAQRLVLWSNQQQRPPDPALWLLANTQQGERRHSFPELPCLAFHERHEHAILRCRQQRLRVRQWPVQAGAKERTPTRKHQRMRNHRAVYN